MNDLKLNHDRADAQAHPRERGAADAAGRGHRLRRRHRHAGRPAARGELRQQGLSADDRGPPVVGDPGHHGRPASPRSWIWCWRSRGQLPGLRRAGAVQPDRRSSPTASAATTRRAAPRTSPARWWSSGKAGHQRQHRRRRSMSKARTCNAVLARLGLEAANPGAWSGCARLVDEHRGALIEVRNPADGDAARAGAPRHCRRLRGSHEHPRSMPPRPGARCRRPSAARRCACSARNCASTSTTSARWSRSRTARSCAEGLGEVQEMIDIADFAVGQSRMLYGLTHAFRAPAAPHVRAVASARASSASSRRSTSRWRCGPGTPSLAAICGNAWSGSPRRRPR